MLGRDMAYAPVAPNWINFDYFKKYNGRGVSTITKSGHALAVIGRFKHF